MRVSDRNCVRLTPAQRDLLEMMRTRRYVAFAGSCRGTMQHVCDIEFRGHTTPVFRTYGDPAGALATLGLALRVATTPLDAWTTATVYRLTEVGLRGLAELERLDAANEARKVGR